MTRKTKAQASLATVEKVNTYKERFDERIALRDKCPRKTHAGWKSPHGRPDPVKMVLASEKGRLPHLLPLRHGRITALLYR